MKNKLNKEEQLLNQKLESVDFDFQEAHWAEMRQMLGKKGFLSNYSSLIKAAAVIITVSSLVYWLNTDNKASLKSNQPVAAEQKIKENKVSTETKDVIPSNSSTTSIVEKDNTSEENTSSIAEPVEDVSSTEVEEPLLVEDNIEDIAEEDAKAVITNESDTQEEESIPFEVGKLTDLKVIGKVCVGETIVLETTSNQKDAQIIWFINGKEQDNSANQLTITIYNNEKLSIKAQLIENDLVIDEKQMPIQALYMPNVDFTYEDLTDVYYDFHAKLKAQPSGLSNYQWLVNGKQIALKGQHISYPFGNKGMYDVTLVYESKEGCVSKMEKPVAIEQHFVPFVNAFSPNGDGTNDEFVPKMFEIVEGDFHMSIFDASGSEVYKTDSYNEPWNGRKNNSGELMPIGSSYVWKVTIQNKEGITREFTDRFKIVEF